MQFDPERGQIDWDGLFTFLLTLLVMTATFGLPLLVSLRYVYSMAKNSPSDCTEKQLLVFGKQLKQGNIDSDYQQRLTKAVELMRKCENCRLLLLGGGIKDEISEAAAGQIWVEASGIELSRMIREEQSQNTLENLKHAREIINNISDGTVVLISNRYHLARIGTIANSLRIDHRLCGCEDDFSITAKLIPRLLIEAWYILWFKTGLTWARLTHNRRMLDRVT